MIKIAIGIVINRTGKIIFQKIGAMFLLDGVIN